MTLIPPADTSMDEMMRRERTREREAAKGNVKLRELLWRAVTLTAHVGACRWLRGGDFCDCGLVALRAEIREALGAEGGK